MLAYALNQIRQAASSTFHAVRLVAGPSTLNDLVQGYVRAVSSSGQVQHNLVPGSVRMQEAYANKRALSISINPAILFTNRQEKAIQITVCTLASISLLGGLVALYWFCQMRKKFRHR